MGPADIYQKIDDFYSAAKNNGNPCIIPEELMDLPVLLTLELTESLTRNPFECHSYERGVSRICEIVNNHNSSSGDGKVNIDKERERFYKALERAKRLIEIEMWHE